MTNMDRISRDAIRTYGPAPTTPEQALAHVLCAFAQAPDDRMVLQATSNIYGEGVITGLALGDLRAIQRGLDQAEQPVAADVIPLPTAQHPGRPASELPEWAVAQLSDRGIDPGEVAHFVASRDGRTIAAAVDDKPVYLTRPERPVMSRPLTCPKCGARAGIAEDVVGYLDWGFGEIGDDGILRPADPEHLPPVVMSDNCTTVGRPRGCCDNRACGYQWRVRRRFAPDGLTA